jgi:hypothetical protein
MNYESGVIWECFQTVLTSPGGTEDNLEISQDSRSSVGIRTKYIPNCLVGNYINGIRIYRFPWFINVKQNQFLRVSIAVI